MTSNNGWPGKPGVPMDPEEPGYHWVKGCDGEDTIVFWRGHGGDTHYENGDLKKLDHWSGHPMWIAQEWTYLGPCLTPDEATALQKRVAELVEALGTLEKAASYTAKLGAVTGAHWLGLGTALIKARAALEGKKDE